MTELQNRLLSMLKWFHDFCVEHDLRYYALGGTLLGAIRHKGFIPWDDDIDVGMPRADYNKLIELSDQITSPYVLETPQSPAKDFVYAYSKLFNTDTTLVEKRKSKKRNMKRGIYLDIFPLDGLGNTESDATKQFKRTASLVKKLAVRVSPIRKGRGFAKNCAVALARCIPQFIINDKKLAQKLDRVAAEKDYDENVFVGNLVCNYKLNHIMQREYFGTPTLYVFEDTEIYGAENYEGYLTQAFGDWRKLPPEEQQVSLHMSTELDLNKSYLDTGENQCKR